MRAVYHVKYELVSMICAGVRQNQGFCWVREIWVPFLKANYVLRRMIDFPALSLREIAERFSLWCLKY